MASTSKTKTTPIHPAPLTIPPLSGTHTSTLILLHGRGSNAPLFSGPLLSTPIPAFGDGATLPQLLPETRFVFPTASFRRATFANRARITQWYDSHRLDALEERPEHAVEGLRESVRYLHGLIAEEAAAVGGSPDRVLIGGLSQGSSTAVTAALTWPGPEAVAAVVGLAGWLPLGKYMVDAMEWSRRAQTDGEDGGDGVVFEDSADETTVDRDISPADAAIGALREELSLDSTKSTNTTTTASVLNTPIFLGHGTRDEKVPVRLGRQMTECLRAMRCDVTWREYDDLGHWYHGEQLADVVRFLRHRCPDIHVNESRDLQ